MRGGQVFMESLALHDVDCIFGNPGTTENTLLDRLIDYPQIRYFVALHEGVAVGAATFHAQATGRTAVANLHVAPGLGNAIGMIYGALKASAPVLVTAGAQDTRMRLSSPLLGHDLVAMAAPVTKYSDQPSSADEIGPMLQRAFKIANDPPKGPVFVSLPVDVMEQETGIGATIRGEFAAGSADADTVVRAAGMLMAARSPCIVTGDDPAKTGAFDVLIELAERLGAAVYHEGLRGQVCFPNRHPSYRGRVPFEAAQTNHLLSQHDVILLLGGSFFENVWHDDASPIPVDSTVLQIENNDAQLAANYPLDLGISADLSSTLTAIVAELSRADSAYQRDARERNAQLVHGKTQIEQAAQAQLEKLWDAAPMSPARAMHELAQAIPTGTIIVDESITASLEVGLQFDQQQPGDFYAGRGGGIGQGLAGAIGTQVAHPDRRVVALSGDGSAMYSIQALWTAAHHELPVVFVIFSNREYRVLKHNLDIYRQRFDVGSNKPYPHMDLTNPALNFPDMARGMGVEGELITDPDTLGDAVRRALECNAPYLLEVLVSGKP